MILTRGWRTRAWLLLVLAFLLILMTPPYFNKTAQKRGMPFRAISRSIDLYRSQQVQDDLALDGLESANTPQQLAVDDTAAADRAVALDQIPAEQRGQTEVTYWSDIPLGIDDHETTRDLLVQRMDALIPKLAAAAESTGGMVTMKKIFRRGRWFALNNARRFP